MKFYGGTMEDLSLVIENQQLQQFSEEALEQLASSEKEDICTDGQPGTCG